VRRKDEAKGGEYRRRVRAEENTDAEGLIREGYRHQSFLSRAFQRNVGVMNKDLARAICVFVRKNFAQRYALVMSKMRIDIDSSYKRKELNQMIVTFMKRGNERSAINDETRALNYRR